ncbi:MAG TPA: MarR family transcriptional regulator [Burkholderiaceae bacterium]|nr:MarR family transcriptional regulator [Burkholderiaceae bacterium]
MDKNRKKKRPIDFPLERRTNYRFSVISTWNMRCLAGLFTKKFGITTAGWRLLSIIGRFEPIHPTRLAELSTLDADKVTRAADRLVEAGLVDRRTDEEDRRRVVMRLTARGRAVYAEIERAGQLLEAELVSVLTDDELEAFYAALTKLHAQAREIFIGKDAWKRIVEGYEEGAGSGRGKRSRGEGARRSTA